MKYRQLRALPEKQEYYLGIEREIRDVFLKTLYLPLIAELKVSKRLISNARQDVIDALQSGQITFDRGYFRGQLNSAVSRELKRLGAQWDRKQGAWKVPLNELPVDVKEAIYSSQAKFEKMVSALDARLSALVPEEIAGQVKLEKLFDTTIYKVDRDFRESVKSVTITPKITEYATRRISKEYTQNLHLYIKDFARDEIVRLREEVKKSTFAGIRYESLISKVQESYGVTERKAKFLARQETMLLATKLKQTRYQEIGIDEYRWKCVAGSPKHPVRPLHKVHDGKIFRWDNPPIVDAKGDRKNPGQDYGCRCTAIPIVKF